MRMKRWINWVKGDGLLASKHPLFVLGRMMLSLLIFIQLISAAIVGIVFILNPDGFVNEDPKKECFTVEVNGEGVDSCEYLIP